MSRLSMHVRRLTLGVLMTAFLASMFAHGVSAAPQPLTIYADIGGWDVWGDVRPNTSVMVALRDGSGKLLGKGLADVYEGYWDFYNFPGSIYPGYTIKATAFNLKGVVEVRKLTVPNLTIAANRDTDVVSGKGPAGSKLKVGAYDWRWDRWGESYDVTRKLTVDATGHYSHDFSLDGINLRGGASLSVSWSNTSKTTFVSRYASVTRLIAGIHSSYFDGVIPRNVYVKATVTDGSSNVLAVGNAVGNGDGYFDGTFTDDEGDEYLLRPGDWLSAPAISADVDWQVPVGVTAVNPATDKVSGRCFPNGRYQLYAVNLNTWNEAYAFGNANSNGSFTKDLTSKINIPAKSYVELVCWTAEADYVWTAYGNPPDWYWQRRLQANDTRER